jgi:hypothetical protein
VGNEVQMPIGTERIGAISEEVKAALGLELDVGTPIYIGPTNKEHMEREHPSEYHRYSRFIPDIVSAPDFVGLNRKDGSIEYIKTFATAGGNFLKVAVRISNDGFLFVRSLYEIFERTVMSRAEKGTLHRLTKQ